MRSNYKKLGPYIQEVNERNTDLEVDLLLGVSIEKKFIPSIANTVGTDMSRYKIVRHNQFAYGPVTSRNGDKISIALLEDHDAALISQSYKAFEVVDHDELMPEYLMMWFRRKEFDRYARYMSHGSTRETFDWDEMCDVELPVPSIEKQWEIVAEYNTVVDRIELNEQINQKLEETAKAIYRQWFEEFEVPVSKELAAEMGKPELEGQPYKSSGGEMVYNEELDEEIPKGWHAFSLGDIITHKKGFAFKSKYYRSSGAKVVKVSNFTTNSIDTTDCNYIDNTKAQDFKEYELEKYDIVISTVGSWPSNPASVVGKVISVPDLASGFLLNQNTVRLRTNNNSKQAILYFALKRKSFSNFVISGARGSANQASVTLKHLFSFKMALPKNNFPMLFKEFLDIRYKNETLNILLDKLKGILEIQLSRQSN